jgi:hypothetical protein
MNSDQKAEFDSLVAKMLARRERRNQREAIGLPRVKGPRLRDPRPETERFKQKFPDARRLAAMLDASGTDQRLWGPANVLLACLRDADTLSQALELASRTQHPESQVLVAAFVREATGDVLEATARQLGRLDES